ncbi:alpha/beta hydrolase [Loktanella sp. DJP18]|uniref:alpha/beta hydrolase n=1 Tax=Loktanella sp. DJP18 TaxID=3409788 RepID=UPI003BB49E4D
MGQSRIIKAEGVADIVCVLVHGRGQSPDDMEQLVVRPLNAAGVHYVLPQSGPTGWYAARAIDPLTDDCRAELGAALDQLDEAVTEAVAMAAGKPVLLAGFSQGACLSVEYLMPEGPVVDAAALLTGCRVGTCGDNLPITDLAGLPVYASCGDADSWIPAASYHDMLGDLTRAGARLRTDMLPGRPHTVAAPEIAMIRRMIADMAAQRPVFDGTA